MFARNAAASNSGATGGSNATLSWTLPTTNFVLQQSADLVAWVNVTNAPVLNLSNLQNRVTLPMSNSGVYYQLKTP